MARRRVERSRDYRETKRLVRAAAKDLGLEDLKFSNGHEYWSAFAQKDSRWIYFSWHEGDEKILVRATESNTDYSGKSNNFSKRSVGDLIDTVKSVFKFYHGIDIQEG